MNPNTAHDSISTVARGSRRKQSCPINRYTSLLVLVLAMGIFTSLSASHAATQIVVFEDSPKNQQVSGLEDVVIDAFKSRFNQMNFMVLDTVSVSRNAGINGDIRSRDVVLSQLPVIQSVYGNVIVVFLKSRLHLHTNRNVFLQSSATVFSSATESQVLFSTIDGDGFLLPRNCDGNCTQILGTRAARQTAETLAMRIGKMLNSPSGSMIGSSTPVNKVRFDLVNFDENKRIRFMDLMINEFPGFLEIVNMQQLGPHTRFIYYSESANTKLQKWISISLRDIGVNPETGADIIVKPGAIQIVITETGTRRGSTGNPLKYN